MSEPVLVGLLFADRVITENNGKKSIIGTFNRFLSPAFPALFPPWFIYAAATNLKGKHDFVLALANDDSDHTLFSIGGQIDCPDESNIIELDAPITSVTFPARGCYILSFLIDNFPLGSRVLTVDQAPESGR